MKRLLLATLLCGALPAMAALHEGDTAPDFKTPASLAGKTIDFSLKAALSKDIVVLYFYPSAYTGGCNIEAHNFADNSAKFADAGARVVGVSLDSITRLNDFSADPDYCAGKIAVASDADGKITKAYAIAIREAQPGKKDTRGVEIDHGFAERVTYIITPDGKIAAALSALTPAQNVAKSLEIVQQLSDAKKAVNW